MTEPAASVDQSMTADTSPAPSDPAAHLDDDLLPSEFHEIECEVEYRQLRLERVVLMGVYAPGDEAETSLQELQALAETAGCEVLEGLLQRRSSPDPATYVGSGKAKELRDAVVASGADTVICDG